jgi:hypothetical protein
MKTSGLSISEACKAVREGRAKAARGENTNRHALFKDDNEYSTECLLDIYTLIDPVPETRRVEVKHYIVMGPNGYGDDSKIAHCPTREKAERFVGEGHKRRIIEMTGYDDIPIPSPEPVEFEGKLEPNDYGCFVQTAQNIPLSLAGTRCRIIVP